MAACTEQGLFHFALECELSPPRLLCRTRYSPCPKLPAQVPPRCPLTYQSCPVQEETPQEGKYQH